MQSNLEKWLKENGVDFFCGRELATPKEITLRCSTLDWNEIKRKYDLAVTKKQFTPVERYVMSFILCELKGMPLTEEMLAPDYDDNNLLRDQISALSLFELVDTPSDEMSKVTPVDVMKFINAHIMSVRNSVDLKKDAPAKQILNDYRNSYYYLLQVIYKKIKSLGNQAALYQENEENAPNDVDSFHSSGGNSAVFPDSNGIPKVLLTMTKPNIDVNSIKINLPVKEESSKKSSFWSFFSWFSFSSYSGSNIFYKTHFYDNAEDKKSSDSTKQAVKDAYHDYVESVNELAEYIDLFNKKGFLNIGLADVLEKFDEVLRKKQTIISSIQISRDEIYIKYFNEDLLAFYTELEKELNKHESTLKLQYELLCPEYAEMQHNYSQLIEDLEDEFDTNLKVTQVIELIENKRIYKELPDMLNKNAPVKLKFLDILKQVLAKITEQARVSNVSIYQEYYEPMYNLIADLSSSIDINNSLAIQIQKDKLSITQKMHLVERYINDLKDRIDNLADNPDINTLAAKLIVAERHAVANEYSSYPYLGTCYKATPWWKNFDSKYQGLKKLLEGKAVINVDKALAQLKNISNADAYLLSLQQMFIILADDYPKTAPHFSKIIGQIIAARKFQDESSQFSLMKVASTIWSFVPQLSPTDESDYTHQIFSVPSLTGV